MTKRFINSFAIFYFSPLLFLAAILFLALRTFWLVHWACIDDSQERIVSGGGLLLERIVTGEGLLLLETVNMV